MITMPSATVHAAPLGESPIAMYAPRAIAWWLLVCCALVFAMMVVGGVTRLTHSGLSITEWQPVVGTLPPLDEADWERAFAKYQATPESLQVNKGMELDEFKGIFWWEYWHRLLGRLIGIVYLVPLGWFLVRRAIPPGYALKLAGVFVLGGIQGAMGWYMVKSGLVDDPRVSQFRLTAHLGLAFAILGAMLWIVLSLRHPARVSDSNGPVRSVRVLALAFAGLVFALVLTGGMVAGIRAGFAYNTFPTMNGQWVPDGILLLEPWWKNFFYNMATVQFDHRIVAWLLVLAAPLLWWRVRRMPGLTARSRHAANLVLAMLALQVTLGIMTLLHVVPLPLAAAHQAGAVVLFALALNLAHAVR